MPTQTSYFQNDVLQSAQRDGRLHELLWFIEADWPKKLVPPGIKRRQPAYWPKGFIPVIPVGPDVEAQRAWAEMLAGLFEACNAGRGIVFKPTLTTVDLMKDLPAYEYGGEIDHIVDHICPKCGQVMQAKASDQIKCECYDW